VFSRGTVGRIDDWYGRLAERWVLDHLPPALLRAGPGQLLMWQWLALPALVLVAGIAARVLAWLTQRSISSITRRTTTDWDDAVLACLRDPLTLAWGVILLYAALPWLGLYGSAKEIIYRLLHVGGLGAF